MLYFGDSAMQLSEIIRAQVWECKVRVPMGCDNNFCPFGICIASFDLDGELPSIQALKKVLEIPLFWRDVVNNDQLLSTVTIPPCCIVLDVIVASSSKCCMTFSSSGCSIVPVDVEGWSFCRLFSEFVLIFIESYRW